MLEPVTTFYGIDGRQHRIGTVAAKNNAGELLCDDYEGHGLRLLCVIRLGDPDSREQARAVIQEYRVDATVAERPLSRRVTPAEIASTSTLATA